MRLDNAYFFQKNCLLKTPFLVSKNFFTKEECEKIIDISKNNFTKSHTEEEKFKTLRKSEDFWIENTKENEWLYNLMSDLTLDANKEWNFDITGFTEPFQLTKYEKGGKYDFHMDTGVQGCPMARKLSIVIQLNDPSEYEGGELEIKCDGGDVFVEKGQGNVVVFPSFFWHRVTEITKGTRYSLVSWVGGPSFR